MTFRADRLAQVAEVSACAATDFQRSVAGVKLEPVNSFSADSGREQEEAFKEEKEIGNAIVSVTDEGKIEICPLSQLHEVSLLWKPELVKG